MPSLFHRVFGQWRDPAVQQALDAYEDLKDEVEMLQVTVEDLRSRVLEHLCADEDPT